MWNFFQVVCFSLYRYTEGSEKGCGSFFLVHSFWVVVCSSGFVSFFPQKMSYLQSCVGCTCVFLSLRLIAKGLSATATFVAVLLLLFWQDYLYYEREMSNVFRINQDECQQQLLVQYWV